MELNKKTKQRIERRGWGGGGKDKWVEVPENHSFQSIAHPPFPFQVSQLNAEREAKT